MGSSTVMYDDASSPVTFKGEDAKNLVNGVSAKAWVNYDMTIPAIKGSFNVSSITDLGAGYFQVTLTTPMPNTNFSTVAGVASSVPIAGIRSITTGKLSSSVIEQRAGLDGSTSSDMQETSLAVFSN